MKKILALVALAFSISAFADTVSLEKQSVNNATTADQSLYLISAKHDFSSSVSGDVVAGTTQTDGTNAMSTRFEFGATGTTGLVGSIKGYTRVAYGSKLNTTGNFPYYSIEPGITTPVGPLVARVGWRWRSAVNSDKFNDQSHTMRYTLSYPFTKQDAAYVRYDRVNGDYDQKVWTVGYTRTF